MFMGVDMYVTEIYTSSSKISNSKLDCNSLEGLIKIYKLIKDMVSYEKDNKVADILKTMLMEMFGLKIQTEKGDDMFNLLNGYIASLFMDYISVHNGINIDDEKSINYIKEIIKESSNKLLEGGFTGLTEDDINLIINRYRQYKKIVEDNENGIIITNKILIQKYISSTLVNAVCFIINFITPIANAIIGTAQSESDFADIIKTSIITGTIALIVYIITAIVILIFGYGYK